MSTMIFSSSTLILDILDWIFISNVKHMLAKCYIIKMLKTYSVTCCSSPISQQSCRFIIQKLTRHAVATGYTPLSLYRPQIKSSQNILIQQDIKQFGDSLPANDN